MSSPAAGFMTCIRNAPSDRTGWLVFADWLADRSSPLDPSRRGGDFAPGRSHGVLDWRYSRNPLSPVRGGPMLCRQCGYRLLRLQTTCPSCGAREATRWWRRAFALALAGAALAAAFAALLLRG